MHVREQREGKSRIILRERKRESLVTEKDALLIARAIFHAAIP